VSRTFASSQFNRPSAQNPSHKDDIKGKSLKWDNRNKGSEFPKVSFTTKCYKCQCYGQLAASCSNLVRITIIDVTPTEATEPDSDVYIFEEEDSETNKEPTGDYIDLNYINQTLSPHLFVIDVFPLN